MHRFSIPGLGIFAQFMKNKIIINSPFRSKNCMLSQVFLSFCFCQFDILKHFCLFNCMLPAFIFCLQDSHGGKNGESYSRKELQERNRHVMVILFSLDEEVGALAEALQIFKVIFYTHYFYGESFIFKDCILHSQVCRLPKIQGKNM